VVRILATGFSRVAPGHMPEAPVPAAMATLDAAGLTIGQIDAVTTHNPFAVNNIYFSRHTGYPLERMNAYGCSLIFGHPQGPTGLRSVAELIEELRQRGGGTGLFTGWRRRRHRRRSRPAHRRLKRYARRPDRSPRPLSRTCGSSALHLVKHGSTTVLTTCHGVIS
jgi:hypothetical protein